LSTTAKRGGSERVKVDTEPIRSQKKG
jgi:hypothetical protein